MKSSTNKNSKNKNISLVFLPLIGLAAGLVLSSTAFAGDLTCAVETRIITDKIAKTYPKPLYLIAVEPLKSDVDNLGNIYDFRITYNLKKNDYSAPVETQYFVRQVLVGEDINIECALVEFKIEKAPLFGIDTTKDIEK